MALLQRAAEHHVIDLRGIDPGALDRGPDRMARERGRGQVVERAPISATDWSAGGGNDDGGTHERVLSNSPPACGRGWGWAPGLSGRWCSRRAGAYPPAPSRTREG